MSEMHVIGVRVEQPQNQPVLLLRETDGERYLPIWIGQTEATAIALEQQGVEPARPLTHDLIKNLIEAFGRTLKEVRIVDLREGTFYADLVFDQNTRVSARPSDSIAIALRIGGTDLRRGGGTHGGRSGHARRARGRGREVQRIPRVRVAGRFQGY